MKKRKLIIVLTLTLMLALAVFATGCGSKEKNVSSVAIADGSFKTVYALDEVPDYSSAILVVTYTDGSVANVSITADMVSGLSTARTVSGAKLTVTYKGKTSTFMYKVEGVVNVDTAVRIKLDATSDNDRNYVVSVKMSGAEQEENGVYAVKFLLTAIDGINIGSVESALTEDYVVKIYAVSRNSVSVVIYSASGYLSFGENVELIKVAVTKSSNSGILNAQSIYISDGTRDYVVPGATITIS